MSDEYFKEVELLKKELENEKGFISAKRYKSNTEKDNYVSISTWKDKKSVEKWHQNKKHQLSQNKGKEKKKTLMKILLKKPYILIYQLIFQKTPNLRHDNTSYIFLKINLKHLK